MNSLKLSIVVLGILPFIVCASSDTGLVTLPEIDISGSPNGIVLLPDNIPPVFTDLFAKYTKIIAPNGKPIHLLAQSGWTEDQIKKARNVLEHILTDYPGSEFGSNKAVIANDMSDRRATMILFNTPEELRAARGQLRTIDLSMQDLRANECPAEGTEDYMNHITRDASFEEVMHLVHDYGVKPALPEFHAAISEANDVATERGWRGWPDGESENHPNEYIGVIQDNYLDLWTVQPKKYEGRDIDPGEIPEGMSHFGRYFANSRAKLKEVDPMGYEVVEKFFQPYLTYTPELPESFEGTFSIAFDESMAYTYKSQHLKNVRLTGNNDANITGNGYDNILSGNIGSNVLKGGAGDDQLDGDEGNDTAVYTGPYADYSISTDNGYARISDKRINRDGTDTLRNIEILQFSDRRVELQN